jgi:hypothetical protein
MFSVEGCNYVSFIAVSSYIIARSNRHVVDTTEVFLFLFLHQQAGKLAEI